MADMLEKLFFDEALKKHQQTPLSEGEQIQEYDKLGDEYVEKLMDRGCFLNTLVRYISTRCRVLGHLGSTRHNEEYERTSLVMFPIAGSVTTS